MGYLAFASRKETLTVEGELLVATSKKVRSLTVSIVNVTCNETIQSKYGEHMHECVTTISFTVG